MAQRPMKILCYTVLVSAWLGMSCITDAPHDNPLDPQNPNSTLTLRGRVFTLYPPYQGIAGVGVWLEPLHRFTRTDEAGAFGFTDLKTGTYTVVSTMEGYASDTMEVVLKNPVNVEIYLDALPQFRQIVLTSHHYARFFPPDDLYFLTIDVLVSDRDGHSDIVRMWYELPDLTLQDTLRLVEFPDAYSARFIAQRTPEDYQIASLHLLIGKAFTFRVEDKPGMRTVSPAFYLTRIVETIPVHVQPTGLVSLPVTQDSIRFEWEPVVLPYPFSFRIEIYRLDFGVTTLVSRIDGIASSRVDYLYKNDLTPGDHLWFLYVVDEYGNTGRSREGAFRIVP